MGVLRGYIYTQVPKCSVSKVFYCKLEIMCNTTFTNLTDSLNLSLEKMSPTAHSPYKETGNLYKVTWKLPNNHLYR